MNPTQQIYAELQQAYDVFNAQLFQGKLPDCLLTLQREKRTYGYFCSQRFGNRQGQVTDEIALNPAYFAVVPLVEVMQTLVHEMVHLWQKHYGTPGRTRYHNREWGDKMEEVGLMPSNTGKPGGRKTGDQMMDYPIEGGAFLKACAALLTKDFRISWYDRFPVRTKDDMPPPTTFLVGEAIGAPVLEGFELGPVQEGNKSNRKKYTCGCSINVWGKPGLKLRCEVCAAVFAESD